MEFIPELLELILKDIGWIPGGTGPSFEPLLIGMKFAIIGLLKLLGSFEDGLNWEIGLSSWGFWLCPVTPEALPLECLT